MRWAFIHPASGAIVMVTTSRHVSPPAHLVRRCAPVGVEPRTHWWNGWSFAPRVDAPIAATMASGLVSIACADDAWLSFPDGSIGTSREIAASGRRARVSLVGRYRGEAWIEPEGAA